MCGWFIIYHCGNATFDKSNDVTDSDDSRGVEHQFSKMIRHRNTLPEFCMMLDRLLYYWSGFISSGNNLALRGKRRQEALLCDELNRFYCSTFSNSSEIFDNFN